MVRYRRYKRKNRQPEHQIQTAIIEALRLHGDSVFRQNVGKVRLKDGRFFSTGLPNGSPDLYGWRKSDKQIFFIEVKAPKGRIRPAQMAIHLDLMHQKVIHGIARSINDALKIVSQGLIGYGYPDSDKKEWHE